MKGWLHMGVSAVGLNARLAALCGILAAVLSALLLFGAGTAYAVEPNARSADRDISLTVRYETEDSFRSNVDVLIYRVADVADDGTWVPIPALAKYPINWHVSDAASAQALANTIESYILLSGNTATPYPYDAGASSMILPVDVGATDENGVVVFPTESESLEEGCYLITACADIEEDEVFEAAPVLLQLPYSDESGALNYAPGVSLKVSRFSLSRTISLDVMKQWEAESDSDAAIEAELAARTDSVTVTLLCNGYIYDTVMLNEANGWHHSWDGLSREYAWNVVEENVPEDYEVSIFKDGTYVSVVNTLYGVSGEDPPADGDEGFEKPPIKDESPQNKLPQTGMLWWPVPVLLTAGVGCLVLGAHGRRKNE